MYLYQSKGKWMGNADLFKKNEVDRTSCEGETWSTTYNQNKICIESVEDQTND